MNIGLDFRSIAKTKVEERARLLRALARMPETETEPEHEAQKPMVGGFDGGARPVPLAPPPSHEETLIEILNSRAADVGARGFE